MIAFPPGKFGVILADPPWPFATHSDKGRDRSPDRHYPTMSLAEIKGLPVASLAAKDCALFLRITRSLIFEAGAIVKGWEFTGKSIAFVWIKPRKDRQADLLNPEYDFPYGLGYGSRANAELCLLATRGRPTRIHADVGDVIEAPRERHSRKPIETYERIERLFPGPYVELFAQPPFRPSWTVWGNEVPAADAAEAAPAEAAGVPGAVPPL
jgi:N6-adenosine-specific RNA methylase IME4